jgi:hypothetical protein
MPSVSAVMANVRKLLALKRQQLALVEDVIKACERRIVAIEKGYSNKYTQITKHDAQSLSELLGWITQVSITKRGDTDEPAGITESADGEERRAPDACG